MEDSIESMKEEILALKRQNMALIDAMKTLTGAVGEMKNNLEYCLNGYGEHELILRNLPYEIQDPNFIKSVYYPEIMSVEKTLDLVIHGKKSICRFGDGEFSAIACVQRWKFQKADEKLSGRLKEVLISQKENIVIALNNYYGAIFMSADIDESRAIRQYLTPEIRRQQLELLSATRIYGNAGVFAPKVMERAKAIQKLWKDQDCIIVEGEKTRFGVGNDLLDGAKSVKRILCPARNAFDRYDEILSCVKQQSADQLILISLGPTATVLAYDLADEGYHAVDIGHCDIVYELYCLLSHQLSSPQGTNLEFKDYLAGGGELEEITEVKDISYQNEIIADFSK